MKLLGVSLLCLAALSTPSLCASSPTEQHPEARAGFDCKKDKLVTSAFTKNAAHATAFCSSLLCIPIKTSTVTVVWTASSTVARGEALTG